MVETWKEMRERLEAAEREIKRLKEGDFTEEEFQNLCWKFGESDYCRFRNGCFAYQKKMFGGEVIEDFLYSDIRDVLKNREVLDVLMGKKVIEAVVKALMEKWGMV